MKPNTLVLMVLGLSAVVLSTANSSALALNDRFRDSQRENLNSLNDRFRDSHRENLNAQRSEEASQETPNC